MKRYFFIIFMPLLLLLTSCDNKPSLAKLCQNNKQICLEFGEDNWCKVPRNAISLAKIALASSLPSTTDTEISEQKYQLLIAYEGYIECMSLASQIQHIKLKDKTAMRKNNLFKAQAKLSELTEETAQLKHPHLLYYQWTRQSNEDALEQFLQLEGSEILENSTAQYHLATYYVKRDINKTLSLLFHSLELHQPGSIIEAEVLQTLATIFTNKNEYKQAYIWLKIYQLVKNKRNDGLLENLVLFKQHYELDSDLLDKVAESTLDKIEAGKFTTPRF